MNEIRCRLGDQAAKAEGSDRVRVWWLMSPAWATAYDGERPQLPKATNRDTLVEASCREPILGNGGYPDIMPSLH